MSKRRSRTPRAPPPGVSKRVKGSPRVRNSFIMRNNQTPGWAKKLNEENRNLGMVAMSEDIDQNKLEKFEKDHAKNRSNQGMKFTRRASTWKMANKGWNPNDLKQVDPTIEKRSRILKAKPKWGSYGVRGVCNYVSPRGPPESLGTPPRPFTPCWAYTMPTHQHPTTTERLKAKRKQMNQTIGIDFDGDGNVDETEAKLSSLILRAEGATVEDVLNPAKGKALKLSYFKHPI